jgi:hypothetical protein
MNTSAMAGVRAPSIIRRELCLPVTGIALLPGPKTTKPRHARRTARCERSSLTTVNHLPPQAWEHYGRNNAWNRSFNRRAVLVSNLRCNARSITGIRISIPTWNPSEKPLPPPSCNGGTTLRFLTMQFEAQVSPHSYHLTMFMLC